MTVRIFVRPQCDLPKNFTNHENLTIIRAPILELSEIEMARYVKGCDAVASCLGHNMSLKGIYAHPRRLATDATRRLCNAIKENKSEKTTRFVLMNPAGNDRYVSNARGRIDLICCPVESHGDGHFSVGCGVIKAYIHATNNLECGVNKC